MSLWDNDVLVGKQVLYTILGNDVLNLQAQGFRTKQVTTAHCMHHNRAGSSLASVPFPPHTPPQVSLLLLSLLQRCGTSRFRVLWDSCSPLTWLSDVTKCCTVWPSAVVISWIYVASSCQAASPASVRAGPLPGGSQTAHGQRPGSAGR